MVHYFVRGLQVLCMCCGWYVFFEHCASVSMLVHIAIVAGCVGVGRHQHATGMCLDVCRLCFCVGVSFACAWYVRLAVYFYVSALLQVLMSSVCPEGSMPCVHFVAQGLSVSDALQKVVSLFLLSI